ncbi:MAG: flagellar biosynthesis protein FlhB [Dehalococcoidia bacterium]
MAEKTEAPTERRKDDARKRGQVSRSDEVVSIGVLLAAVIAMRIFIPGVWDGLAGLLRHDLGQQPPAEFTTSSVMGIWGDTGTRVLLLVAPFFGVIMAGAVLLNVGQTGLILSGAKLKPNMGALNPGKGVKRIISVDGLVNLVKAFAKMGVVTVVVYIMMKDRMAEISSLAAEDIASAAGHLGKLSFDVGLRAAIVLFFLALLDFGWQRRKHLSQLRMTKEEVRQESRESEGDPQIKAAIRRRRQQLMNRMLAAVPTADVVVTNPTHFAVAIKYDPVSMAAPVVVAKGQQLLAQRIKDVAAKNGIPVVEEPPLARALYKHVQVGSPIPGHLFHAVAEVLAWVYALRSKVARPFAGAARGG